MAIAAKPLEFSAEEIAALRRIIAREIEREQEEKADAERRHAAVAKTEAGRAETERLQRAGREVLSKISHNSLRDSFGHCQCADCIKERATGTVSFAMNQ